MTSGHLKSRPDFCKCRVVRDLEKIALCGARRRPRGRGKCRFFTLPHCGAWSQATDVFCVLSEAAENNVSPGVCQSSSVVGKEFDKACSGEERAFPSTTAPKKSGGDGGFTCCVPGCFNNNKKNPELSFYNCPKGKSPESQELRKKWIHLIYRNNFSPTLGHRVCSQHFPGGRKTYMFTDHRGQNN